jgi:hypothetical protein
VGRKQELSHATLTCLPKQTPQQNLPQKPLSKQRCPVTAFQGGLEHSNVCLQSQEQMDSWQPLESTQSASPHAPVARRHLSPCSSALAITARLARPRPLWGSTVAPEAPAPRRASPPPHHLRCLMSRDQLPPPYFGFVTWPRTQDVLLTRKAPLGPEGCQSDSFSHTPLLCCQTHYGPWQWSGSDKQRGPKPQRW